MARTLNLLKGVWEDVPEKKKRNNTEERVKDDIKAWLESQGCYMRVIKSDGRKLPNGKWIPSKQGRGISDLIGVTPQGRFIAVEVKAPGKEKTATPEQLDFLEQVRSRGGFALVASSVEQVRTECRLFAERLQQA